MTDSIETIEIKTEKKRRGGARKGSGQKKGSVQLATITKAMELLEVQSSIKLMARKLLNSQAIAALGTHKMIVIEKDEDGIAHVRTIRDEETYTDMLDNGVYGKDYLIVAGAEPDWKAAEALLNRAGLKPKEKDSPHGLSIYQLILQNKNGDNSKNN